MTLTLRGYIAALLACVLVLTGHSMAIARGLPTTAGFAEYCLGESAVMVPVDSDGNPTGPAHLCPEVSVSLFTWVTPVQPLPQPKHGASVVMRSDVVALPDVFRAIARSARAPPVAFV